MENRPAGAMQASCSGRGRWLLAGAVALGFAALAAVWFFFLRPFGEEAITGELVVHLRAGGPDHAPSRVGDNGVLPARAEHRIDLQIRYKHPAHTYVVWLTSAGEVVPLYPWNMDKLEVKKLDGFPTGFRSAKYLVSPMTIGHGWPVGPGRGLETILLLASREPLAAHVKLDELFAGFPPSKLRDPQEFAVLSWSRASKQVVTESAGNRGTDPEAKEADAPVLALFNKLGEHFDFIQAVRFAHDGER